MSNDLEFDENGGIKVPIENILDVYIERNKRLTLEVSMLEVSNELLKAKVFELQKKIELYTKKNIEDI